MRIPIVSKGNPQKKLISFRFLDFVNSMVKAEAEDKDTSESILIERKIIDSYLNEDERLARIVAENIAQKNGIVECAIRICEIFKTNPTLANDTLIECLEYLKELIQTNEIRLKTTDDGVEEFARYAAEFENHIKDVITKNPAYHYRDTYGKENSFVDSFSLFCLKDMSDANTDQYKLDTENLMYLCFAMVLNFWNFGGTEASPSLKNWNVTYCFLQSALRLCKIPDYGPYIFKFSQTVKNIDMMKKGTGAYDSSIKLSKKVFLKMKAFDAVEDAVIMKTVDSMPDDYFDNALRIIHGPGKPVTKKLYILLTKNEEEKELYQILSKRLEAYPDEFPDVEDAYAVQFLYDGLYYDKRVRWTTI